MVSDHDAPSQLHRALDHGKGGDRRSAARLYLGAAPVKDRLDAPHVPPQRKEVGQRTAETGCPTANKPSHGWQRTMFRRRVMTFTGVAHGFFVHRRRARVLASRLAAVLPNEGTVLDVGCGDGLLAELVGRARPGLSIRGIDVIVRENPRIPVEGFDGRSIPFEADQFDAVMLVDVLHHTQDPTALLAESARVARTAVVVKDHTSDPSLAHLRLRLMDRVGNARHGVALPYNYWTTSQWSEAFDVLGLQPVTWETDLRLYPGPVDLVFGRALHFIARLETEPT